MLCRKVCQFAIIVFAFASYAFALDVEIIPTLGYTNYFSQTEYARVNNVVREHSKIIGFSCFNIGLDILIIEPDSHFTFFFNNHVCFFEESKEHGGIDIVRRQGSSVVEGVLWDANISAGYTFLLNNFRIGLGGGVGIFSGSNGFGESSPFGAGIVLNANMEYFFVNFLALSFGMEEGIYGSVKKKKDDELLRMYNRFCMRVGVAIKF